MLVSTVVGGFVRLSFVLFFDKCCHRRAGSKLQTCYSTLELLVFFFKCSGWGEKMAGFQLLNGP